MLCDLNLGCLKIHPTFLNPHFNLTRTHHFIDKSKGLVQIFHLEWYVLTASLLSNQLKRYQTFAHVL